MSGLAEAGATLLGGTLARIVSRQGGNLSQVVHIVLSDGREVVVKNGPSPRAEATMLRAISARGEPAPDVLAVDDTTLVLSYVSGAGSLSSAWADLGASLARLHRTRGAHYGWETDYAFGSVHIVNARAEDWPSFWAQHRLRTHLPHLPADLRRRVDALACDLPNRLPARPKPALLHGDCWTGNLLAVGDRLGAFIDPACYYGDAEVDLAMLTLFDDPPVAFWNAYGQLALGHQSRRAIYQLWPALVHLRLFGPGYRSMAEQRLSASGV